MAEHVVVSTPLGDVRGKKEESVRGATFYSFQGIPYAKPPVGDLRFKNPEPLQPWTGVRDALEHGSVCPSVDFTTAKYSAGATEDCLFVNVYTPNPHSSRKLPVLFWVHGGGFSSGSGNREIYGPEYLVTEDVVLVTFNYRLCALGFLSLQTPECPGNYGLKDMVMALKWVQQNISSFGGDPNRVTIFGESAGGAAVNYLMISPLSKGLFHGAISQSGSCLSPWALSRKAKYFAFCLGEKLGLKTKNEKELMDFLKKVDVKDLITASSTIQDEFDPDEFYLSLAFVPVVEPEGTPGAFLTVPPQQAKVHDVPYINGMNTLEGLLIIGRKIGETLSEEDLTRLIPADMNIDRTSEKAQQVVDLIRERYFKDGYSAINEIKALSTSVFLNGMLDTIHNTLATPGRKSPVYTYLFSFDDPIAVFKRLFKSETPGTCHGDELIYLFNLNWPGFSFKLQPDTKAYNMMETLTKLWTNFAKTGNPTSEKIGVSWEPTTTTSNKYLEIGDELKMGKDLDKEEKLFWEGLYKFVNNK